MTRLQWSDALSLDLPAMDDSHREFVKLLDLAHEADDAQLDHELVDHHPVKSCLDRIVWLADSNDTRSASAA